MNTPQITEVIIQGAAKIEQTQFEPGNVPNFEDAGIVKQFQEVKIEIKKVLDGAYVDSQKLSFHFTV